MSTYADWQSIQQWTGDPLAQGAAQAIAGGTIDTGVLQVGSWASIILWAKATTQKVTAVVTQTVANGPAALTISQTIVIPAGSQEAQSIIMFGTQVEIVFTGGGAGCILDYAVVPSNTTTAASVTSGLTISGTKVVRTANQSIPNNVFTALDFTGVTPTFNEAGMFNVANPTRLTAPVAGLYLFGAAVYWAASGAGSFRGLSIRPNGGATSIAETLILPTAAIQSVQQQAIGPTRMSAGDYVEAFVLQDSGGALLAITDVGETPMFWGTLLGP